MLTVDFEISHVVPLECPPNRPNVFDYLVKLSDIPFVNFVNLVVNFVTLYNPQCQILFTIDESSTKSEHWMVKYI